MKNVVEHLRRLVASPEGDLSDSQLLGRFITGQDQAAFALLVRRHGPMVLGVCQRVLRHLHDAEDAFQAAFFILARKAASVAKRESLSSWLYSVAYRAALEAKTVKDRRQARELPMGDVSYPAAVSPEVPDWRLLLDQEVNRLPDKYRAAVVLCDLEGRTSKEVAKLLGMPQGTVWSRLSTARQLLAKRLARHGLALSGSLLASTIADGRVIAEVPLSLALATAKAAVQFVSGQSAALALPAAALTTRVMKTMLMTKLKMITASALMALAIGASGLAYYATIGAGTALAQDGNAKSELEALRKENDLLRRSLELALDKVRTQETSLREMTAARDADRKNANVTQGIIYLDPYTSTVGTSLPTLTGAYGNLAVQPGNIIGHFNPATQGNVAPKTKSNPQTGTAAEATLLSTEYGNFYALEQSIQFLQGAKDKDATKKAIDALEAAVKQLKESLKPSEPAVGNKKELPK